MDEAIENKQKDNLTSILNIPLNIIKYMFTGLKFVLYEGFIELFNSASYKADAAYRLVTKKDMALEEGDILYEKTKSKPKKEKVYKYSEKTLAKLAEEQKALQLDLQNAGATRSKVPHVYYYKVRKAGEKIQTGTMNGFSKLDVNAYLLNEGYEVYVIKTTPFIDFMYQDSGFLGNKRMSTKDLIFWLTQLCTYLKAGIKLNEAIKILNQQMKGNKARKRAMDAISYELLLGENFSRAMEKQGNMFPPLLINMIKAAEASGTLIETLDDMADYYTEMDETRKQMVSAMTYPTIITVFSLVVIVFILTFVVPQFTDIYASNGTPITGITKLIVNISDFIKNQYVVIIGVIALVIIGLIVMYKSLKIFRTNVQILLMHIPIVKNVIIYNEMAIFSKTFASLLKNNVFITDSMDILSKITTNEIYKAILYRTINNIVKGEKISEAFKDHWAVPDVAYYMIVTGESTGDLANMMQKVSEYYQSMHRNIVNNLKAFIEPVMISLLALIVGAIIIAVIVPMFEIYNQVQ